MLSENKSEKGYGYLIDWIVRVGDLIIINGTLLLFYSLLYRYKFPGIIITGEKKVEAILIIILVYFIASIFIRPNISGNILLADKIARNSVYFSTLYALLLAASFTILDIVDVPIRFWLFIFALLLVLLTTWHILCRITLKVYRSQGYNYRNLLIIGGNKTGQEAYQEIKSIYSGYKIIGYFDDEKYAMSVELPQYLGSINKVIKYLETHKIDEIYYTLPTTQGDFIVELMNYCEKNMIRFHLVPNLYQYVRKKLSLQFLETIPILSLRLEPLQHPVNRMKKRAFDIVCSLLVIIFVYPFVYLIFAPIIKLTSSGPIHFLQKRTGFRGREFNCIKFRSMRRNVDADKKMATKNDPRITAIGAFMRRTSIDELPQFINVLKGEMSVVGPRPHMLQHTEEYSELISKYMVRHLVKPGITGWAQVTGSRGETRTIDEMEERVKKDVWYIENWSLFLDLKIVFKTLVNAILGEDRAY